MSWLTYPRRRAKPLSLILGWGFWACPPTPWTIPRAWSVLHQRTFFSPHRSVTRAQILRARLFIPRILCSHHLDATSHFLPGRTTDGTSQHIPLPCRGRSTLTSLHIFTSMKTPAWLSWPLHGWKLWKGRARKQAASPKKRHTGSIPGQPPPSSVDIGSLFRLWPHEDPREACTCRGAVGGRAEFSHVFLICFFVNNAFFCFLEKPAQPAQSTSVDPSGGASGKGHLLGAGGPAASWLEGFIPDTGPPSMAQQLPASTHSLITNPPSGPSLDREQGHWLSSLKGTSATSGPCIERAPSKF